jgi:hypothetical protein
MGFRLGSFVGGVAKGASESIEEMEKLNTTQINDSVKSMYHNYQEYRKEVEKKKIEMKEVVDPLRSIKFADGTLNDQELIGLATNVPLAKQISKMVLENPERLQTLSKDFIKGSDKIPQGMTLNDYIDTYGKTARMSAAQLDQAASTKEDGFLNKMIFGDNVKRIRNAASRYGVTAEELYSVGAAKNAPSLPTLLEVDYAKLQKTPEFKDLKDKALVTLTQAKQSGTDDQQLAASKNLAVVLAMDTLGKNEKKTQQDTELDYSQRILNSTDPKEKAKLMRDIRTMQEVWANPSLKKLSEGEKITTGNKLTAYKGIVNATIENYLPPGTFILNAQGDIEVKELGQSVKFAKGKTAGREAAIALGTDQNGRPKTTQDQLALASIGVQFDQDGKAYAPKIDYPSEAAPAPAATPRTGRGGGPMANTAPAMPPRFNTPEVAPIDKATARAQAKAAIADGAKATDVAKRFKETYKEDL